MAECLTIARPYAKAVFSIATKEKAYDKWSLILEALSFVVQHKDVARLIANQTIDHNQKSDFLVDVLQKELDENSKGFVYLLAEAGRLEFTPYIRTLFEEYKDEQLNALKVKVTSAVKLKQEQKKNYLSSLSDYFKKNIEAEFGTDKSLLGGVVVRAGDTVIDFSIKGKLAKLGEALSSG